MNDTKTKAKTSLPEQPVPKLLPESERALRRAASKAGLPIAEAGKGIAAKVRYGLVERDDEAGVWRTSAAGDAWIEEMDAFQKALRKR